MTRRLMELALSEVEGQAVYADPDGLRFTLAQPIKK